MGNAQEKYLEGRSPANLPLVELSQLLGGRRAIPDPKDSSDIARLGPGPARSLLADIANMYIDFAVPCPQFVALELVDSSLC